jgi:hypothetical protein
VSCLRNLNEQWCLPFAQSSRPGIATWCSIEKSLCSSMFELGSSRIEIQHLCPWRSCILFEELLVSEGHSCFHACWQVSNIADTSFAVVDVANGVNQSDRNIPHFPVVRWYEHRFNDSARKIGSCNNCKDHLTRDGPPHALAGAMNLSDRKQHCGTLIHLTRNNLIHCVRYHEMNEMVSFRS